MSEAHYQPWAPSSNHPDNLPLNGLRPVLPEQFARIGQGGQFAVYMLTDPGLSQPETPPEQYIDPRVIKHALGVQAMSEFVRSEIKLTDEQAVQHKVNQLIRAQLYTLVPVLAGAALDPTGQLRQLLGNPRQMYPMNFSELRGPHDAALGLSYTQRYAWPVGQLFDKLNWQDPVHLALGRRIVRQFVTIQTLLPQFTLFDGSYKLCDNYGVTPHGQLQLSDFSELILSYQQAAASVQAREWKDVPNRTEHTQLPAVLRPYFNAQLRRRLTTRVLNTWGTAIDSTNPQLRGMFHAVSATDFEAMQLWMRHLADTGRLSSQVRQIPSAGSR